MPVQTRQLSKRIECDVANIKSAKKRILTNRKRQERNRRAKSAMRTAIKKVDALILSGSVDQASGSLRDALSKIGKTAQKNIIKKGAAARMSSRLTKRLNRAVAAAKQTAGVQPAQ